MTDNDVIKAFECCEKENGTSPNCDECPASGSADSNCFSTVRKKVLEIVKRQKADNEALQNENKQLQSDVLLANQNYEHIKDMWEAERTRLSEKIKEYIDKHNRLIGREAALHDEAVEDFAHFLIDKAENGAIQICDLPDLVLEWKGGADND
ncbi:MAG: hypothetical protein IKY78_04255 [Clostridia bacterium]|nr:hypothetical protein [Clostridia bacterium]